MSLRRVLPVAALLGVAVAAPASAAPFVLTEQSGIARDVVRGSQWAAWIRCPTPTSSAEIWARQIGGAKTLVQIPTPAPLSNCTNQMLLGISGPTVIARTQSGTDPARLVALAIPTGAETVLDKEVADATDTRIVTGDAYGPLVAWVRHTGAGADRRSEVLTWDLREPTVGPKVVRGQKHVGGGTITGVWRSGSGEVMWRQAIPGGQYAAYSTGEETLTRRTVAGELKRVARVTGPIHIAHADLERNYAVWSLIRDDSNTAYIYSRDLLRDEKQLLKVAPSGVRPSVRLGVDSPAPSVYGSRTTWRERERLPNRSFRDLMRSANLITETVNTAANLPDRSDQRIFQSPPDLYGRFATWAIVRFGGPTGWAGGYSGVSTQPATTQIVVSAVS